MKRKRYLSLAFSCILLIGMVVIVAVPAQAPTSESIATMTRALTTTTQATDMAATTGTTAFTVAMTTAPPAGVTRPTAGVDGQIKAGAPSPVPAPGPR
jgi:hypothetical protein